MITFSHIQKSFNTFQALSDLTFSIPEGTIFGLLGPNGAGKTTSIRILNRIYQQDAGSITAHGEPITQDWVRHNIGYLPEERGLYPKMTVKETLLFFSTIRGQRNTPQLRKRITQYLEEFDLTTNTNKAVSTLSKGMQQKVQIIASILHTPKLLILDEPFTGLDPVNTKKLKDLIQQLSSQGMTIILSTHRMEQVEALCQEIVLINKGKAVLSGSVNEIKFGHRTNRYKIITETPLKDPLPQGLCEQKNTEIIFQTVTPYQASDYLKQVLETNQVILFEEQFPSLEEIFIRTVNNPEYV